MIEVGNKVFYARVVPQCDIYEVLNLTVRTVSDKEWCIGVDSDTRQAYPFEKEDEGTLIFLMKKKRKRWLRAQRKSLE